MSDGLAPAGARFGWTGLSLSVALLGGAIFAVALAELAGLVLLTLSYLSLPPGTGGGPAPAWLEPAQIALVAGFLLLCGSAALAEVAALAVAAVRTVQARAVPLPDLAAGFVALPALGLSGGAALLMIVFLTG